ncbi:hypothetical protein IZY60_12110 [Lutibacter sp. B2]|nr:hypothetical protein [Lutibacter sp. B2]
MHRILKSSFVTIGEKKEIISTFKKNDKNLENTENIEICNNIDQNERYNETYQKKMLEVGQVVEEKINQANLQAQSIIADAYEDAKKIYKNAKDEGYGKGYDEGKNESFTKANKEVNKIIDEALQFKNETMKLKEKIIRDLEKESIELVIRTVEKILNDKIEDSHETIINLIKVALEKCAYTESLVLRVSTGDYEYVALQRNKILCLAENIEDIIIKQDASLKRGSCILDTISGRIDASIDTQFNQIKSLFLELLESEDSQNDA